MITDRFELVRRQHAGSPAVIDGEEELTYRELGSRTDACARFLSRALQPAPGDVVAVSLPNCWEFVACCFAIVRAGAIMMPLNPQWRPRELGSLGGRVPLSAAITTEALAERWKGIVPPDRVIVADEPGVQQAWRRPPPGEPSASCPPRRDLADEPALYLTTSGSTGRPKLVPRTHRIALAGAGNVGGALGLPAGRRLLSVIPFHHSNGFSNCLLMPLLHGASLVLMRNFTPAGLVDAVARRRAQVLIASPFLLSLLVDHGAGPEYFSSVDLCISSGAPLSRELAALVKARLGMRVRQLYGSTETGTVSIERDGGSQDEGSVGKPLNGVEVRILDNDGGELGAGETGEIAVRSGAVMPGYLDDPEENARRYHSGFFLTGDLGRLAPDGSLVIAGRKRRWINLAGVKVDPVEIEQILRMLPQVAECRVDGAAGPRQSEMIRAEIAFHPGQSLGRGEVVAHCRMHLAEYKIPRVIEFTAGVRTDIAGKRVIVWEE
jgi:long-chain acyl-CoA synthetase